MNPHHAAALALVGWYLMVPPDHMKLDDSISWVSRVPLRYWQVVQSFDTASDCEKKIQEIQRDTAHALNTTVRAIPDKREREETFLKDVAILNNLTCVATDDPRLKEK